MTRDIMTEISPSESGCVKRSARRAAGPVETECLRAYAQSLPSQGGVEIGPWLEKYAAQAPAGSAIVELGSWLGAGTAFLALGANETSEIHVYDRWEASPLEVEKAARFGVALRHGEDTLPRVMRALEPFRAKIVFHKGSLKELYWGFTPIGVYVDDATKVEPLWLKAMAVFKPHFIAGETILVLMDYHFDEKGGEKYAAQKRYMAGSREFEWIADRIGGSSAAVFRYLGEKC